MYTDVNHNYIVGYIFDGFQPGGILQAMTVDSKGYVYVLDSYNALVYKFNTFLELLGVWGGQGTGDYQLDRPRGIVFGQGSEFYQIGGTGYLDPINVSADLIISEYWSDNTGIRRFVKGTDITYLDATYKYSTSSTLLNDKIIIDVSLLDDAYVTINFIKDGVVEGTIPQTAYNAGSRTLTVQASPLPNGAYTIELTAISIYGTNTVVKSQELYIDKESTDADGDNVTDDFDNCISVSNPLQIDTDGDGFGDACDCCLWNRGNVNGSTDEIVDISDLVFMVDFMYRDGADFSCLEEADLNGSGAVDISDLVYMVAFMFQGGADPLTCPDLNLLNNNSFVLLENSFLTYLIIGPPPIEPPLAITSLTTSFDSGYTTIELYTDNALKGIEFYIQSNIDITPINLMTNSLDFLYNYSDSVLHIGILDLSGAMLISSGTQSIVKILGNYQISSAVAVDENDVTVNVILISQ